MISLFDYYPDISTGTIHPGNWHFIKTGYLNNLKKVKSFYGKFPLVLNSSHFLVRLLESLAVPMDVSLNSYFNSIDAKAVHLAMGFGITCSNNKGNVFDGVFYGKGSVELFLLDDSYFNNKEVNDNWQQVSAVTPLLHPKSDMDLLIPNGKTTSPEEGLSVISINISKLAVQYRAFLNAQDPDNPLPTTFFVSAYVLPNMLDMQTEISFFNRLYNVVFNVTKGINVTKVKHSFNLANYEGHLDTAIINVINNIEIGIKRFETILKTIPSIVNDNIYQSLLMPDVAPTLQVDWLLTATRLKAVNMLLALAGTEAYTKNSLDILQIVRSFHANSNASIIGSMLPNKIASELSEYHAVLKSIIDSDNVNF